MSNIHTFETVMVHTKLPGNTPTMCGLAMADFVSHVYDPDISPLWSSFVIGNEPELHTLFQVHPKSVSHVEMYARTLIDKGIAAYTTVCLLVMSHPNVSVRLKDGSEILRITHDNGSMTLAHVQTPVRAVTIRFDGKTYRPELPDGSGSYYKMPVTALAEGVHYLFRQIHRVDQNFRA
jgi:hypothetical protein